MLKESDLCSREEYSVFSMISDFSGYMKRITSIDNRISSEKAFCAFSKASLFADNISAHLPVLNFCGGEFSGKTFILLSMLKYIKDSNKDIVSLYLSAEELLTKKNDKLAGVNVLLIDDIDSVDKQEVYNKIEMLYKQNKNIAFSSASPIVSNVIEPVYIQPADSELLKRIFEVQLNHSGVFPSDNEMIQIAHSCTNIIR